MMAVALPISRRAAARAADGASTGPVEVGPARGTPVVQGSLVCRPPNGPARATLLRAARTRPSRLIANARGPGGSLTCNEHAIGPPAVEDPSDQRRANPHWIIPDGRVRDHGRKWAMALPWAVHNRGYGEKRRVDTQVVQSRRP